MLYLEDIWNHIDCISLILNYTFLASMTWAIVFKGDPEYNWFEISTIRRVGGCTVFFMLVKVFYWMRLFESTAKYVRLIT